jgi:hypothetical protein
MPSALTDPWHPPIHTSGPATGRDRADAVVVVCQQQHRAAVADLLGRPVMLLSCWRTGDTLRDGIATGADSALRAARADDRLRFRGRPPARHARRQLAVAQTHRLLAAARNRAAPCLPVWTAYSETDDQPICEPVWLVGLQPVGIRSALRACALASGQQHLALGDGRWWSALRARRRACGRIVGYRPVIQPPLAITTPVTATLS